MAIKCMTDVATAINEYKRRKDLGIIEKVFTVEYLDDYWMLHFVSAR